MHLPGDVSVLLVRLYRLRCAAIILLIRVEVIEEQIVVLDAVFQVIDHLLLLVDLDAEATSVIEDVVIVVNQCVSFAIEAASSRNYELPFSLLRVVGAPLDRLVHTVVLFPAVPARDHRVL